jgi:hypothetical protein
VQFAESAGDLHTSLAFSHDGRFLAATNLGPDGLLELFGPDGELLAAAKCNGSIQTCCFLPGTSDIVLATYEGKVLLFRHQATPPFRELLSVENGCFTRLLVAPDGKQLFVGGTGIPAPLISFTTDSNNTSEEYYGDGVSIRLLAAVPPDQLLTAGLDGDIRRYQLGDPNVEAVQTIQRAMFVTGAVAPSGKVAGLLNENPDELILFDTATLNLIARKAIPVTPRAIFFSPDSKIVGVVTRHVRDAPTFLHLFTADGKEKLATLVLCQEGTIGFGVSQDGRRFALSVNGRISVWTWDDIKAYLQTVEDPDD